MRTSSCAAIRRHSAALVLLLSLSALTVGCGGSQGSGPAVADATGPAGQAVMPREARDPDRLFQEANFAFQNGNVLEAQRLLGEISITSPTWGGGVVDQALSDTCARLGNDCDLVRERLGFIRAAWFGQHGGPRGGWVPQQEEAYNRIVACYDHLLVEDWNAALAAGGPVTTAPLPAYAQQAQRCVERAQRVLSDRERQQRADAALQEWHANYPCMDAYRRELLIAYSAEDWEDFVNTYPQYEVCAQEIARIVDSGLLDGDSRLGLQHDLAFTHLSEIEIILEDHHDIIVQTRRGLVQVQSDPAYAARINDLAALDAQIAEIEVRLRSLQSAVDAVTGAEAEQLRSTLSAMQQGRDALVARRAQLVGELNAIRAAAGLPPRESF